MALKYGDAVTLIQKSRDGTLRRVNAIVLVSVIQPDGAEHFHPKQVETLKAMKGQNGKPLPGGEYLDVAYPDPGLVPEGQTLKARSVEQIFRLAYSVAPWKDDRWIGWQPGSATAVAPTPLPSADDLDAVPAEQKAAEDTQ